TCYGDLLSAILTGDRNWDDFYREKIDAFEAGQYQGPPEWLVDVAAREQFAYQKLWDGNFADSAAEFSSLAADVQGQDARFAAWFCHWEGFSYALLGNKPQALQAYASGANSRSELGRPRTDDDTIIASGTVGAPSEQAKVIARLFASRQAKVAAMIDGVL